MSHRRAHCIVVCSIVLAAVLVGGCVPAEAVRCAMCSKVLSASGEVTLVMEEGRGRQFCCVRCALLYVARASEGDAKFTEMRADDYESGQPLELREAFFVYGSSTVPCCVPSILPVGSRDAAEALAEDAGGEVLSYAGLRSRLAFDKGRSGEEREP